MKPYSKLLTHIVAIVFVITPFSSLSAQSPQKRAELPNENKLRVEDYDSFYDPLEGINRPIFGFNKFIYDNVAFPLADGYRYITPRPVRTSLNNFFDNLRYPINVTNHILQGDVTQAGEDTVAFVTNTVLGLAGMFKPAQHWWELDQEQTGFADTVGHYGVGYGFYMVLPILGPSTLTSALCRIPDWLLSPIRLLPPEQQFPVAVLDEWTNFESQSETIETILENAKDPYLFLQGAYLQGEIRDARY